jgi:Protein of unknown function (DUF1614)
MLVLLASLAGSVINIPVARLRGNVTQLRQMVTVFGMRYVIPVVRSSRTTVAVNVGGAVVPAVLSAYLIAHDRLGWLALAAVAITALFTHAVARPVRGLGIAVPALLPGIFAAAVAIVLHPVAVAGLAYVGGTLGTLVGADLLNMHKIRRLGAPVASIGGRRHLRRRLHHRDRRGPARRDLLGPRQEGDRLSGVGFVRGEQRGEGVRDRRYEGRPVLGECLGADENEAGVRAVRCPESRIESDEIPDVGRHQRPSCLGRADKDFLVGQADQLGVGDDRFHVVSLGA